MRIPLAHVSLLQSFGVVEEFKDAIVNDGALWGSKGLTRARLISRGLLSLIDQAPKYAPALRFAILNKDADAFNAVIERIEERYLSDEGGDRE